MVVSKALGAEGEWTEDGEEGIEEGVVEDFEENIDCE